MGSNRRLDRGTAANLVIEDLGKAEGNRSSAEAGDDAREYLAQRIQMVSAFQGHGESARAEAGRRGPPCCPALGGARRGQGVRGRGGGGGGVDRLGDPGEERA